MKRLHGASLALLAFLPVPLAAQTTERVSLADGGGELQFASFPASSSVDGRHVLFVSFDQAAPGDTDNWSDVFRHDRQTGLTELVSLGPAGASTDGHCSVAHMTPDGRFVAFRSSATDIVAGEDDGQSEDVFVRDLVLGTTERVSVGPGGVEIAEHCDSGRGGSNISDDGRYVVFETRETGLLPGEVYPDIDVFVRDRVAGTTVLASVPQGGGTTTLGDHVQASISGDGRTVVFFSDSSELVPAIPSAGQIFARDLVAGVTELVSLASDGNPSPPPGSCMWPVVSRDGSRVAFGYRNGNVMGANEVRSQLYLRDRAAGTTQLLSRAPDGAPGNDRSVWTLAGEEPPSISPDGRYVAFVSHASNLVHGDGNEDEDVALSGLDVFVRDVDLGVTWRASVATTGAETEVLSIRARMGPDGRSVLFASYDSGLVPGITNDDYDVFLHVFAPAPGEALSWCEGGLNSAGRRAELASAGAWSLSAGPVRVSVSGAVQGQGQLFTGPLRTRVPFGNGFLCLAGSLRRLPPGLALDAAGAGTTSVDLAAIGGLAAGERPSFQLLYRDAAGAPADFDLSDALSVTVAP